MQLKELDNVTAKLAKALEKDGWTVSKLATARPANLAKYEGVGLTTAKKIIKAAQDAENESGLQEAAVLDPSPAPQPPQEEPAVSVRIRRLRELNKGNG